MESFLNNLDHDKLNNLFVTTANNVDEIGTILNNVVVSYAGSLDELLKEIYTNITSKDSPDVESIERYFLKLTNHLYFMGDKLETLGIYDDVSKTARKEVYNKAYLNIQDEENKNNRKPTVAQLQSSADEASKYEEVVNSIYKRAYMIVKSKVDSGYEVAKALSKILSRRMQENQINSNPFNNNNRQLLNEG